MAFFRRLFGRTTTPSEQLATHDEQTVLVYLNGTELADEVYQQFDLATLEDRLIAAIARRGVGVYDGHEFGPTNVVLFMYGPDADRLFTEIEPILRGYPLCANARVVIRPGPPGTEERELTLWRVSSRR